MKSNHRWIHQQASPPIPPSSNYSYFTEQAHRAAYVGPGLGRAQREHFQYHHHHHHNQQHLHLQPQPRPSLPPYAHDMHEAMQREIEKEQIRDEIIMSENIRRRVLEAEVRRELMMERELALRRGNDGLPFGPSPVMGFDSQVKLQLLGMEKLNVRHENGGFETSPFQRGNADLRVSEVKPVSEGGGKVKEKIILLAKPDGSISGSKRKVATPPPATETPSDNILRKKAKEEWSCALCHVSATSQRGLDEHLRGKKHKSKEAALKAQKAGKNYSIGLFPRKIDKSVHVVRTIDPVTEDESASSKKSGKGNLNLEKNQPAVVQNKGDNKKKHRFWCEMCQVGAHSMKVMNSHKKGKKHVGRLERSNRDNESQPSDRKEKIEDGESMTPKDVHEGTDEVRSDQEPVAKAEPEDPEPEAEAEPEDLQPVDEPELEDPEPADEAEPDVADELTVS